MKRTLLDRIPDGIPDELLEFLAGTRIYDSSCSPEARVYFIDKDEGYYLKVAAAGTLAREAQMTAYFHSKGLGAEVLRYLSEDKDYFLTAKV